MPEIETVQEVPHYKGVTNNFLSGITAALETEPEPKEPKEEKGGKADPGERPDPVPPGDKPAVAKDTDPKDTKPPVDDAKDAKTAPVEPAAKTEDTRGEDWSTKQQPKSKQEWEKFRAQRGKEQEMYKADIKAAEAKALELTTKLTELETKANIKPELSKEEKARIEQLTQENQQLTEAVMKLRVTEHPKFKAHFQAPIDDAISEAKTLVGEGNAPVVERILKMDDNEYRKAQLDDFLSTLDDDGLKMDIRSIVRDIRKANVEKDKEIKRVSEHNATLTVKETAEAEARAAATRAGGEKAFNDVVKELTDPEKGNPIFQTREGDDAWNKTVQNLKDSAKGLLTNNNLKPDVIVRAAHFAVAMPVVLQAYQTDAKAWKEKEAQYEKQIADLTKAQPKSGQTARTDNGEGKFRPTRDMKPFKVAEGFVKDAMSRLGM